MKDLFVVHHVRSDDEYGDVRLMGVCRTATVAETATKQLAHQLGFEYYPTGWQVDRYEFDQNNWIKGCGFAPAGE